MQKLITRNKKVGFEYFILETYEAGIELTGTEIKSIREGKVSINDAYVKINHLEAFIINMNVSKYTYGNIFNHDETRTRKLLLHKHEIVKLASKIKLQGLSLVPTKVYLKDALCKVEFALVRGKKLYDKRQSLKERDSNMRIKKSIGY